MTHAIHQEVSIPAAPDRVFHALTDGAEFSAISGGAPATIEPTAGAGFSCFGGMIEGRNIEVVAGQRLVQAWRVKHWEPGQYSIARFELSARGEGTRLVFDHTGYPEDQGEHLAEGWKSNYWDRLAAHFASAQ